MGKKSQNIGCTPVSDSPGDMETDVHLYCERKAPSFEAMSPFQAKISTPTLSANMTTIRKGVLVKEIDDLLKQIDDLLKQTLGIILLENIEGSNLRCHFLSQPETTKKAFNQQETEILSRVSVQASGLTRHLLYKLIRYTLTIEKPTNGWYLQPKSDSIRCADDVERLKQHHVITKITFEEYDDLCRTVFPAIERLTSGNLTEQVSALKTRLLSYILKEFLDEDFHALVVCLLLSKDGYISEDNIHNLIVLLNDIRISMNLCVINYDNVKIRHLVNDKTKYFIIREEGHISFTSQNAMDSVFLAFRDLFRNRSFHFDLLTVNDEFLKRYCRTAGYKEKQGELCFCLSSCQTNLFVSHLDFGIIDHPTIEDVQTHEIVCEKFNIPPEVARRGPEEIITFVKHLQNGKQPFFHARGMVVGCAGVGKTSLLKRLKNKFNPAEVSETRAVEVNEHMFCIDRDKLFVRQLSTGPMIDAGLDDPNSRKASEQTISMLDFAGQCAYYACHQIYFNRRAFFIHVIDITKNLTDTVEDKWNEGTLFEHWTYKDFFIFWMKSIHTYSSENAPVILVWTHADKLENGREEMLKSYQTIYEILHSEDPCLLQHIDKSLCFCMGIPKKRFLLKDVDPYCEILESIKKSIMDTAKNLEHWGMEIPTLWAIMERNIKVARKTRKIISVHDLWIQNEKLDRSLRMAEKGELTRILTFLHEVGEILYFPGKGMKDFIILDIQWFVDAFKYIISDLRHAEADLQDEIKMDKDYIYFRQSGELPHRLLQKIWKGNTCKSGDYMLFRDQLISYMERLGMLTSIIVYRKDISASYRIRHRWYVPCMNRRMYNPDEFLNYAAISSILCFEFQFLPNIIFYKLLSSCMESGWNILCDSKTKCLYQKVAVFYRFDCFIFVGICRNAIEVQVRNLEQEACRRQRSEIRDELEKKLQRIAENFHTNLTFNIGYRCSHTKFCDLNCTDSLSEEEAKTDLLCKICPVEMKHYLCSESLLWRYKNDDNSCAQEERNHDHRDFELLLDVVASKTSRDISMIAGSLSVDHDIVDQISRDHHHSVQEKNFQILYHWRNKRRQSKEILYKALQDNDREDIISALENFTRDHYKCPGVVSPASPISSHDINLVSREVSHEYTRLARFLRLPQRKMDMIKLDFRGNMNECILRTLMSLRNVSRQDICNGLIYISRMDITEKLMHSWNEGF